MKAILLESHGSADSLKYTEDFPTPKINQGEALIRVRATSLNRVDTVLRRGYPGLNLEMPHILGGDIAGEIAEINDDSSFHVGDRVVAYPIILPKIQDPKYIGNEHLNDGWKYYGMHIKGSYCEYIAVPIENLNIIPNNITFEEAAALPIAGLTAYHALSGIANLQKGDLFFIWGGSGGLGTLAIQIAKGLGATIIATCGKSEKMALLKELGADYVFNHYTDDVVNEVKQLFPAGMDAILDYVGPATFDKSFAMARKGGKILLCGMITGMEIKVNIQQAYFRQISILGLYLGSPGEFTALLKLFGEHKIKPHIHKVFDLKDAADAHMLLESGDYTGKIVLKID